VSDFPRGWTLTAEAALGSITSIVVPAVAGVARVLDAVFAKQVAFVGAPSLATRVRVSTSDGAFTNFTLLRLDTLAPSAGTNDAEGSISELNMAGGQGASLTVAFDGSAASIVELLVIQGHDI
jgi:hypothetical protein